MKVSSEHLDEFGIVNESSKSKHHLIRGNCRSWEFPQYSHIFTYVHHHLWPKKNLCIPSQAFSPAPYSAPKSRRSLPPARRRRSHACTNTLIAVKQICETGVERGYHGDMCICICIHVCKTCTCVYLYVYIYTYTHTIYIYLYTYIYIFILQYLHVLAVSSFCHHCVWTNNALGKHQVADFNVPKKHGKSGGCIWPREQHVLVIAPMNSKTLVKSNRTEMKNDERE